MAEEIDLDAVLISAAAFHLYHAFAEQVAKALVGAGVKAETIPNERARLETDGSLTVFVEVPNLGEVRMSIPAGQWAWTRRQ